MGRSKLPTCFSCLSSKADCIFGTSKGGYCVPCHKREKNMQKNFDPGLKYDGFFNETMKTVLLVHVKSNPHWHDSSSPDIIEIRSGSSGWREIELVNKVHPLQPWEDVSFTTQIDGLVGEHFPSKIKSKFRTNANTSIVDDAIRVWEYLSFLVAEQQDRYIANEGLSFKLTNLVVYSIEQCLSTILTALKGLGKDKQALSEVLASTGLLSVKFRDVLKGLEDESLQLLWGDQTFKAVLIDRLQATIRVIENMLRSCSLCCSSKWREQLSGQLDTVFANMRSTTAVRLKGKADDEGAAFSRLHGFPNTGLLTPGDTSSSFDGASMVSSGNEGGYATTTWHGTQESSGDYDIPKYSRIFQSPNEPSNQEPQNHASRYQGSQHPVSQYQGPQYQVEQPEYSWTQAPPYPWMHGMSTYNHGQPASMPFPWQSGFNSMGARFDGVPFNYNLTQFSNPLHHHANHRSSNNNNHLSVPMSGVPGITWDIREGMGPDATRSYQTDLCMRPARDPSFSDSTFS